MAISAALGLNVTTYDRVDGTYGYIIHVNTLSLLIDEMLSLLVLNGIVINSIDTATEVHALISYLEDEDCPNVAYALSGDQLIIFLKSSVFPYAATTRISPKFNRLLFRIVDDVSRMDFNDRFIGLFKLYALESAYLSKVGKVPYNVRKQTEDEESRLTNEL